jgi:6-phosphofructokinase 1
MAATAFARCPGTMSAASCIGAVPSSAPPAARPSASGKVADAPPRNLLQCGIDRLVIIGGDGSLTGANCFVRNGRNYWRNWFKPAKSTKPPPAHPALMIAGLVGSIDNDMVGTDMTIGADSALHRIVEAIDALTSTAASHQRSFVVEVMGRHCGYLALTSAIAGGTDYVLIPENPPAEGWEEQMCETVAPWPGGRSPRQHRRGRRRGHRSGRQPDQRRLGAAGAGRTAGRGHPRDHSRPRSARRHAQRLDRWMSTLVGHAAVQELLAATPDSEPQMIGMRYNRVRRLPLMQCVEQTRRRPDHRRA